MEMRGGVVVKRLIVAAFLLLPSLAHAGALDNAATACRRHLGAHNAYLSGWENCVKVDALLAAREAAADLAAQYPNGAPAPVSPPGDSADHTTVNGALQ